MTAPNTPSPDQLAALRRYRGFCKTNRARRDKGWKQSLLDDWHSACEQLRYTPMKDDICHLQTLRNTLGPQWLEEFTLTDEAANILISRGGAPPQDAGHGKNAAEDLLWRIKQAAGKHDQNPIVTQLKISMAAWALSNFNTKPTCEAAFLDALGLVWVEEPMGGFVLKEKA